MLACPFSIIMFLAGDDGVRHFLVYDKNRVNREAGPTRLTVDQEVEN